MDGRIVHPVGTDTVIELYLTTIKFGRFATFCVTIEGFPNLILFRSLVPVLNQTNIIAFYTSINVLIHCTSTSLQIIPTLQNLVSVVVVSAFQLSLRDDIKSSSKLIKNLSSDPSPSIFNCHFSTAAHTIMPSIYLQMPLVIFLTLLPIKFSSCETTIPEGSNGQRSQPLHPPIKRQNSTHFEPLLP